MRLYSIAKRARMLELKRNGDTAWRRVSQRRSTSFEYGTESVCYVPDYVCSSVLRCKWMRQSRVARFGAGEPDCRSARDANVGVLRVCVF